MKAYELRIEDTNGEAEILICNEMRVYRAAISYDDAKNAIEFLQLKEVADNGITKIFEPQHLIS